MVGVQTKCEPSLGRVWAEFGQSVGGVWAECGRSLGRVWADLEEVLVGYCNKMVM